MNYFLTAASEFVYYRTYSRWRDDLGRRETWPETVERVINFLQQHRGDKVPKKVFKKIREGMLDFSILPSMRLVWAAGPAAEADNVSIYNCAFLAVDCIDAFAECLYILMNGTGVGFSVERKYVEKLPKVPEFNTATRRIDDVRVSDDKAGWADSVKILMKALYSGNDVNFDYSGIRKKGARLKTMGGRASGPEPLASLHNFIRDTFTQAQGRKLSPLEVSDIFNGIADIVQVGGVRRSSQISLSDLDDDEMRDAKVWPFPSRRFMSNNSAVYTQKPDAIEFLKEWTALAASGTGERGIFNLDAARKSAPKRRNSELLMGTNPCKPLYSTVLTQDGYKTIAQLLDGEGNIKVLKPDGSISSASRPFKTGRKRVYKITLSNGTFLYGTENHRHKLKDGDWTEISDLSIGDWLEFSAPLVHKTVYTDLENREYRDGILAGWIWADGWCYKRSDSSSYRTGLCVGSNENSIKPLLEQITGCKFQPHFQKPDTCSIMKLQQDPNGIYERYGISTDKKDLDWLRLTSPEFKHGFIQAAFSADGSVRKKNNVELYANRRPALSVIHDILKEFSIYSTICVHNNSKVYIGSDGKTRNNQTTYKISVYAGQFKKIGLLCKEKQDLLNKQELKEIYRYKDYASVTDIEALGEEDVYDITVFDDDHLYIDNGVTTHNCGEIVLRNMEFCNLSTIIVRPEDDLDSLLEKAETAAWIGTIQASFTHFPYIRKKWRQNCQDEALLGVSISGQMDNAAALTADALKAMKSRTVKINKRAAKALGINEAAAITCTKPEGTSSQITFSGSGIHPWYAPYYIRRYRISATDPLYRMMLDQGFEFSPENGQTADNATTWVVSFPMKAPKGAIFRNNLTALEQLEWYKHIQTNWCEHNASITVYVKDDEWLSVGHWVYSNWDIVNGVSFLPYDNGHYEQAPNEEISEKEYEKMLANFPKIDYSQLSKYEDTDLTEGAQTYACVGDKCEMK